MKLIRMTAGMAPVWKEVIRLIPADDVSDGPQASIADIERAVADPRCYLLLAVDAERHCGWTTAYRFPDVVRGGDLVYLYDIVVEPTMRRKGVGAMLVRALLDCCRRDGALRIWAGTNVANLPARQTFERSGALLQGESYAEYTWWLSDREHADSR